MCPKDVASSPHKYSQFIVKACLGLGDSRSGPVSNEIQAQREEAVLGYPSERQCRREILPNELSYPRQFVDYCSKYKVEQDKPSYARTIDQGNVLEIGGVVETYAREKAKNTRPDGRPATRPAKNDYCLDAVKAIEAVKERLLSQDFPSCRNKLMQQLEEFEVAVFGRSNMDELTVFHAKTKDKMAPIPVTENYAKARGGVGLSKVRCRLIAF